RQRARLVTKRGRRRHESARGCKRRACRTPRRLLTDANRRNSAKNLTGISAGNAKRARQIARLEQQRHSRWDTRWPASTRIDHSSPKASALHDVRYEELFRQRVCVAVAPQHPFARRRAIPIAEVAAEPVIGLTREDYPNYY